MSHAAATTLTVSRAAPDGAPRARARRVPARRAPRAATAASHAAAAAAARARAPAPCAQRGDGGDGANNNNGGGGGWRWRHGGNGGGNDDDDSTSPFRNSGLALGAVAAIPVTDAGTRGGAEPFIDARKVVDLGICLLLPPLGVYLYQNNVVDKARALRVHACALMHIRALLARTRCASCGRAWMRVAAAVACAASRC
jgi:hypothetical protein